MENYKQKGSMTKCTLKKKKNSNQPARIVVALGRSDGGGVRMEAQRNEICEEGSPRGELLVTWTQFLWQ